MKEGTATFAVVGAVNHGKSSVVAALAENSGVRISSMPGETADCQHFSLAELFVFIDTPGFQNAHEAFPKLEAAEHAEQPLEVFRKFVQEHERHPERAFDAECRLFSPIIHGAGLIYVVDGSKPVEELNRAEMDILQLTAAPRLAVINRTSEDNHVAEWKHRLGMRFNAVREFDAHRARFIDRIDLLETLAGMEQSWKPSLTQAIRALQASWDERMLECAEIIIDLVRDALTHKASKSIANMAENEVKEMSTVLIKRYLAEVSDIELKGHKKLIKLFNHALVDYERSQDGHLADDLFSEETWKAFGLNEDQLIIAAAVAGAVGGSLLDVLTGGHTLGLGTLIGGALGAAGGWWTGKEKPEFSIDPPGEIPLMPKDWQVWRPVTREISVGPCKDINFPWVLLDRALVTFAHVSTRSHARRDPTTLRPTEKKAALDAAGLSTSCWEESERKELVQMFKAIREGTFSTEARGAFKQLLIPKLLKAASVGLPELTCKGRTRCTGNP